MSAEEWAGVGGAMLTDSLLRVRTGDAQGSTFRALTPASLCWASAEPGTLCCLSRTMLRARHVSRVSSSGHLLRIPCHQLLRKSRCLPFWGFRARLWFLMPQKARLSSRWVAR